MFKLETTRLLIEELGAGDRELVLAVLNDPDFIRNVADRGIRSLEQAQAYIEQGPVVSYRQHNFGMYKVTVRNGDPIGLCGLVKRDGLEDVDIGFAFLPEFRQQGYALEAAQAVMNYAINTLGLPRVVAIASPDNLPSIRLLQKLGLRSAGFTTLPGEDKPLALLGWSAVEA